MAESTQWIATIISRLHASNSPSAKRNNTPYNFAFEQLVSIVNSGPAGLSA